MSEITTKIDGENKSFKVSGAFFIPQKGEFFRLEASSATSIVEVTVSKDEMSNLFALMPQVQKAMEKDNEAKGGKGE